MAYEVRNINYSDESIFETLAKWFSDPDIMHFIHPNFKEQEMKPVDASEIKQNYYSHLSPDRHRYLIYDEDVLVGETTLQINPPQLMINIPLSGWVSICIGNKDYWRKGAATFAMTFLEDLAKSMGIYRLELGVFDFNEKARSLYSKLGYFEFAKVERFTFYDSKWHDDIRMHKIL